jgi:hypothetical protein
VTETMAPETLLHLDLFRHEAEGQIDIDLTFCLSVASWWILGSPAKTMLCRLSFWHSLLVRNAKLFRNSSSGCPPYNQSFFWWTSATTSSSLSGSVGVHPWDVPYRHCPLLADFLLQLLLLLLGLAGEDH